MTQNLFDKVIACAEQIEKRFRDSGKVDEFVINEMINARDVVLSSVNYRRAHISTVDARETKKLYLLHVTVFPHTSNPAPIYGFDIVCGPTKVSGAFHDFSWAGSFDGCDDMEQWFSERTKGIEWNKPRELPEWAKRIFSPSMVAIGAVGPEELDAFIALGLETLDYYLDGLHKYNWKTMDNRLNQNRYCHYQKQNPRTPASLQHLGFTAEEATEFVETMLFPEIS
jgi:hypothetical protein